MSRADQVSCGAATRLCVAHLRVRPGALAGGGERTCARKRRKCARKRRTCALCATHMRDRRTHLRDNTHMPPRRRRACDGASRLARVPEARGIVFDIRKLDLNVGAQPGEAMRSLNAPRVSAELISLYANYAAVNLVGRLHGQLLCSRPAPCIAGKTPPASFTSPSSLSIRIRRLAVQQQRS